MTEQLIKQRQMTKRKKPRFKQQDAHKLKSIVLSWRRPKGLQSKMRLGRRGYSRSVSVGYRSPRAVRGMLADGKKPVLIKTLKDLESLTDKDSAIISKSVGARKKKEILTQIIAKGMTVANLNPEKFIEDLEKKRKEKQAKKKVKQPEPKKNEKKEGIEATLSEDDKKKVEKKVKDKTLTKRV